ncbi:MAG: YcxB family protein [Campylobacterales bacterium]|nr:YcxB family protein [Campylobacterales bacterium]
MSSAIDIVYVWNKETFLKASKATYDYEMKHSPKRFLGWIFIAFTQFGVVGALKKDVYGLLIISTVLVIYWYAMRWPLRKIILLKSFEASSNKNHKFIMSADNAGIKVDETLIKWDAILEVLSLKNGFLLYHGVTFLFIPKDAFFDVEEKDKFSQLAKKNIQHYKKDS